MVTPIDGQERAQTNISRQLRHDLYPAKWRYNRFKSSK